MTTIELLLLQYCFEENEFTDVVLKVCFGDEPAVSIASNKTALSLISDVFSAQFFGAAARQLASEALEDGRATVTITDCSAWAMSLLAALARSLLRRDETAARCLQVIARQVDAGTIGPVLYACEKYLVPGLREACWERVNALLASATETKDLAPTVQALLSLRTWRMIDASERVTDALRSRANDLFESQALRLLPVDVLQTMLEADGLSLSEDRVWQRCLWFVEQRFDSRDERIAVLRDRLAPRVRFTKMSLKQFVLAVGEWPIMTKADGFDVAFSIARGRSAEPDRRGVGRKSLRAQVGTFRSRL